jgi:16S rRNA (cytosine1402-N4)-methyltransferase
MAPVHQPAMVSEVLRYLDPAPGKTILDMTVGMGGHARKLIEAGAYVIGIDRDREALPKAAHALSDLENRYQLLWGRMSQVEALLAECGIRRVDGCLIDAGISMDAMLDPERGFSAHSEASLDMRMDRSDPGSVTAYQIVNAYLENDLARIFAGIGRGREARRVAAAIVRARRHGPITNTAQLADIIAAALAHRRPPRRMDAAPFLMGLRVVVNDEINELRAGIEAASRVLLPTGRLVILSWDGLQTRVSRQTLRQLAQPCRCSPALPCTCNARPVLRVLTPKPLYPSAQEVATNPATRSVRLHAAEKLPTC